MAKRLSEVWSSRKKILEGVLNNVFKKEHVETIAEARLIICRACPLIDNIGDKCLMPGTAPCCSECGCKLSFKARSLSSECPHPDGAKWSAILTEEEEDNTYKAINYNPDKNDI